MSAPSPLLVALIDALASDPDALDQLAAALAPRLTAVSPIGDCGSLTTSEAAHRAGVHERTVRRALGAGTLDGHVIAGRWRIEVDSLDQWLKVGAPTTTAPTHSNGRSSRMATAGGDAIEGRTTA